MEEFGCDHLLCLNISLLVPELSTVVLSLAEHLGGSQTLCIRLSRVSYGWCSEEDEDIGGAMLQEDSLSSTRNSVSLPWQTDDKLKRNH